MAAGPWRRIGWRNLGRNRRRTAITAAGLAVGYLAVVVMVGVMEGLIAEMIENGTGLLAGQIQVHDPQYLPERSIYETIGGGDGAAVQRLVRAVASDPAVEAAAPRVYAGGLVSSGNSTVAALLMGVDVLREPSVSQILGSIVRGRLPEPASNEIVIGVEMARRLEIDLGDEAVLVAPAADGSMGNDLYAVAGIFKTGMAELDGTYGIMPIGSLQRLIALAPDRVHEIAAATTNPWLADEAAQRLETALAEVGPPLAVEPWTELRPEMLDYASLAQSWNWVMLVIVFGIAVFGVANTMLMATFERRREFAVMLALGTTPMTIVWTVLYEAIALGLVSLVVGALITAPVLVWWHNAPPDLSFLYGDFTIMGALVRPVLRVEYPPETAAWAALALLATVAVASLYPAARAARIPPADILAGQ